MKTTAVLFSVLFLFTSARVAPAQYSPPPRELATALDDIGCTFLSTGDGINSKIYTVQYVRNNLKYTFTVSLSPDNSRLWISMPLKTITPAGAAVNGGQIFKLLARNQDLGPNHFKIVNNVLCLSGSLENTNLQNARIRKQFEDLITQLEASRKDWDVDWSKPLEAPAPVLPY